MSFSISYIIQCYAQGYFLMADDPLPGQPSQLNWYSSRDRTLMPLDDRFRYPKSLRRVLNQQRFQIKVNQAFSDVVKGCANRPSTWISDDLKAVYHRLHRAGYAHSFETWQGDQLAGGILGIIIGSAFIGESMFFNIPEGSKVALVELVTHLRHQQFQLFDAQMMNPHLARFGAVRISAEAYEEQLYTAVRTPNQFWPPRPPADGLPPSETTAAG